MLSVALQQAAQLLTDLRDVPEVDTEILLAVTIRVQQLNRDVADFAVKTSAFVPLR